MLNKFEKETTILYNDGENTATVCTCNKALMNKLNKHASDRPEEVKVKLQDYYSKTFIIPKSWVKISPKRKVSEKSKEEFKNRMAQLKQKSILSA